jgi:uncharacterized protein (TIGR03083 family)
MDRDQSWQVIERERHSLADLLQTLTEDEWEQPSLCYGWRIRDVAAHVALAPQPPGVTSMLVATVRAGGRFHRLNHDVSVRHAQQRSGAQLVAELREHAASHRLPVVTSYRNILFDILVHGQDIAIPLGRTREMPPDAAATAATRVWTMGWPFWAKHRLKNLRLTATDVAWTVGRGADVQGPIASLLLLLTGRTAALPHLSGRGIAALTSRLGVPGGPGELAAAGGPPPEHE